MEREAVQLEKANPEDLQGQKNGDCSFAVGTNIRGDSNPPPPPRRLMPTLDIVGIC